MNKVHKPITTRSYVLFVNIYSAAWAVVREFIVPFHDFWTQRSTICLSNDIFSQ
jgi:hypothetical protein